MTSLFHPETSDSRRHPPTPSTGKSSSPSSSSQLLLHNVRPNPPGIAWGRDFLSGRNGGTFETRMFLPIFRFGIHPSKTDMTMEKQLFEDVLVSPIEKLVFFYCHVCFRGCTKNLPKTTVCPKVLNITLWNFPKTLRFVSRGPHFAPAPNKGLQRLRLGRWLELQPRSLSGWVPFLHPMSHSVVTNLTLQQKKNWALKLEETMPV